MSAVLKSTTGISIAETVFNDIISKNSRYYYFLGKILSWNPLGVDLPEVALENYKYELETRSNIVALKRVKESDVSFVIPRINWTMGTVYDMYDDMYSDNYHTFSNKSSLDDALFYVVTDESNVYKCISNNYNSVSTMKPMGIDTSIFTTADGYQWKFMYNIPIGFKNKFFESTYMPITTAIKNQYYSKGQLLSVIIDNSGSGYVQSSTTITVTGDGYLEENPFIITNIIVSDGGIGYTFTPIATITSPAVTIGAEIQATALLTRYSGVITAASLTQVGYGYDNSAIVSITEPVSSYLLWRENLTVTTSQKIKYLDNYYNVNSNGNLGTTPPTHTTGTVSLGTTSLTFVARQAKAYLTFSKTEASVTPIINGTGQVTGATITNPGIGYSYAILSVVGIGTGAKISVNLSQGDLNTIQANVELLAVDGSLSYIKVENKGSLYSNAVVVIEGDGTGATAIANIVSGQIVSISITSYGQNYTHAKAYIVGTGSGATLRAIMTPNGGHGKNAILELHARTLMFFTGISNERNQGILVNNDNRQLGIIKSPNRFESGLAYRAELGSACHLLECGINVNQSLFFPDGRLRTGAKQYYIVSVEGTKILIQSIDNDIPVLGDVFSTDNGNTITPTAITFPSVDKYSGNMLFVDNRNAFTTSAEQTLSLRTTIQF